MARQFLSVFSLVLWLRKADKHCSRRVIPQLQVSLISTSEFQDHPPSFFFQFVLTQEDYIKCCRQILQRTFFAHSTKSGKRERIAFIFTVVLVNSVHEERILQISVISSLRKVNVFQLIYLSLFFDLKHVKYLTHFYVTLWCVCYTYVCEPNVHYQRKLN